MRAGQILLCLAYVFSQFYRAFLAVPSGELQDDIGAGPDDLAFASGLWFMAFAAMQLPVGWALDRIGPRRTTAVLLLLGCGGGAVVFSLATGPLHAAASQGGPLAGYSAIFGLFGLALMIGLCTYRSAATTWAEIPPIGGMS